MSISNLTSCAGEMSAYLQDFDHWQQPIIPPVEDCATPIFDPGYFYEGSDGQTWFCVSGNAGIEQSWMNLVRRAFSS